MSMRVAFYKGGDSRTCGWIATPPHRRPFQGTTMAAGRDLPHDLAQFVVERTLGLHEGFWGLLANGATFPNVPGRRLTSAGREMVRAHTDALDAVEGIVNTNVSAWREGRATPVGAAMDVMYARWLALAEGERLEVEWPGQRLPQRTGVARGQARARRSEMRTRRG